MKRSLMKHAVLMMAMAMGLTFVSCNEDDDLGTGNNGTQETGKATAVVFEYTNVESADMVEYCDIVLEYNDGSGAKTETITSTEWTKTFTTNLPCKYTFKKTITLKADKDMAAVEKVSYIKNGRIYKFHLINDNGETVNKGQYSASVGSQNSTGSKIADGVSQGKFNSTATFSFDAEGKLL